ncbi:MAG: DUF2179 domain-containing protein [Desulfotomaculum sp.]|nr:DUF2179 domain-containing protein [Desulfotomaculum sp.]
MALDVIRILMLTREKKFTASVIGFIEVAIFIIALNKVMAGGMDDPFKVIAYAGGFATGNYVGGWIESIMAVGYVSLQIFPRRDKAGDIINMLRDQGFGVTSVVGAGRSGPQQILFVIVKRRDLNRVIKMLDEAAPNTFFNISDARSIRGGVFPGARKGK